MLKLKMNKFHNLITQLENEYNKQVESKEFYRRSLEEYSNDKEIQTLKNRIKNSYIISDVIIREFRNEVAKHREETNHNDWSYVITPTEIDDCIECKCNICNKVLKRGWGNLQWETS